MPQFCHNISLKSNTIFLQMNITRRAATNIGQMPEKLSLNEKPVQKNNEFDI